MIREIVCRDFGAWMKEGREKKRLSQEELAKIVVCHTTTIGRWERNEAWPPLDYAERIVKALGAELVVREYGANTGTN